MSEATTNSELQVRSAENALGISGDAQNPHELAGRGLHVVADCFQVIGEALATIARLRNHARLAQNDVQGRELDRVGTNMRTGEKDAQTGAEEGKR